MFIKRQGPFVSTPNLHRSVHAEHGRLAITCVHAVIAAAAEDRWLVDSAAGSVRVMDDEGHEANRVNWLARLAEH